MQSILHVFVLGGALAVAGCFEPNPELAGDDATTGTGGDEAPGTGGTTTSSMTTGGPTTGSGPNSEGETTSATTVADDTDDGGDPGDTGSTGPGGGSESSSEEGHQPSCHGTPTACGILNEATCAQVEGCDVNMLCTGTPDPCESAPDCGGCTVVADCKASCEAKPGCVHEEGFLCANPSFSQNFCNGTPGACSTLNASDDCEHHGCDWGPHCQGTPDACETFDDASACEAQVGCSWS